MPTYLIRYVCETALQFPRDVAFNYRQHAVLFLFSQKVRSESTVRVLVDVEAARYQEADASAQSVLQPIMDAIGFSTGSPLLVQHWDFIVKDETGLKTRRAICCEKRKEPAPLLLTQRALDEAQQILAEETEPPIELCWHRYALQRNFILDRFVFQWLAFEALSGKKQVPSICPQCRSEVSHCGKPLLHEGSDGGKAHELFSRIEPDCSYRGFKKEIWGRTRNAVFHGTKYPSPELLLSLNSLTPKLRQTCDLEFNRLYKLPDTNRPRPQDLEFHIYNTNMFEWQTANAEKAFADDFPWGAVESQFGNMQSGEIRSGSPEEWPFKLLDFNRESADW